MTELLSLKKLSLSFPESSGKKLTVLRDINLFVRQGEFLVLVGLSGSGKSTILRIMSGLEKSFTGELKSEIKNDEIGFVFQQFALMPWLTVSQNVEFNLLSSRLDKDEREARVRKQLSLMGLSKFANEHPKNLSGGMRQRVGIARALVKNPKILFMDEPFSELDSFTAKELREKMLQIWRERNLTVVMVTHIISEALELADRIAVLTPRPGKIEAVVENELLRPRNKRSEEFFKLEDRLFALIK